MAYRLLFVCLGNICRSPSAENIMRHLVQEAGLGDQIICDSAGTSSYHVGAAPDRRMAAAAQKRDIQLVGRSRQFSRADFEAFDLILAMDKDNYREMSALDRAGDYGEKLKMICDYTTNFKDTEVPDPYYGGQSGFDYVIDLLLDACQGLLHEVKKEI